MIRGVEITRYSIDTPSELNVRPWLRLFSERHHAEGGPYADVNGGAKLVQKPE